MKDYGLQQIRILGRIWIDGFAKFVAQSNGPIPDVGSANLYSRLSGGIAKLFWKDSTGAEHDLSTGTGGGGGTTNNPGGADKAVQYNNGGSSFGGVAVNSTATKKYLQQVSSGVATFQQVDYGDLSGSLPNSGVSAGTYGSATQSAQIAISADGRITSASNVTITGGGGSSPSLDFTASSFIKDDFQAGNLVSIGELGWIPDLGTISYVAAETNHPGIVRTTVSSGSASIQLQNDTNLGNQGHCLLLDDTFDIHIVARIGVTANNNCRLGLYKTGNASVSNPPNDGIYFERLSTDTDWFGICRAGSTTTRTDTLAAGTTSFAKFRLRRINASTIGFTVDAGTEVTCTTNIPTGDSYLNLMITRTSGTQNLDVDYVDCKVTLVR